MIIPLLLSLTISINALSQSNECLSEVIDNQMFRDLSIPNCINDNIVKSATRSNPGKLCTDCKNNFQKKSSIQISSLSIEVKKKKFIDTAFNEYQKNLTDNMLQTLKLRALQPTGSTYSKAGQACSLKNIKNFSSKCSKETLDLIDDHLKKFQSSISTELAQILSTDQSYKPSGTLLKRNNQTCFIPEKDILLVNAITLEKALEPDVINLIASLNPDNYNSTDEIFLDEALFDFKNGSLVNLIEPLKSHPILSEYAKNPKLLINFFKSIQSPQKLDDLKKKIYSKESGDEFDSRLANSCNSSFNALNEALCSDDFNAGDISLDPFRNYNQINNKSIETNNSDFAGTDDLIQKNIELLSLCEENKKAKKDLTTLNTDISKNLPTQYSNYSLPQYLSDKYEKDIGQSNIMLCKETCDVDSFQCKMFQNYKLLRDKSSTESKLANSSNAEVNALLRSMIGDTKQIDPQTRSILVAQGILPKEDGTLVPQPDIPERRADFVSKAPATSSPAPVKALAKQGTNASQTQSDRRPANSGESFNSNYVNPLNKSGGANFDMPDFSDLMGGTDSGLKEIQDEIKRRLMDLPAQRPTNIEQAKQIARSSFEKNGKNISPYQESKIAERLMQPQSMNETPADNTAFANRASVSDTDTELEKWKKNQMNQALAGMAGAQAVVARDIASSGQPSPAESKAKELTKVALNIAEDPKVTLSELFSSKLNNNDSETQLLKVLMENKSNFLLQVKDASFKIVFDENNNYNLLFESGNKQEAEKIRPQLEIFLKRLKKPSKNTSL